MENVRIHSVPARTDSSGSISATSGVAIPEGYYQLTAEHGAIIRVQNLGIGHWTMLEPFETP